MKITYLGHSCFHFLTDKVALLVDPFISGNDLASGVDIDAIRCDHILISHGHQDHMLDAERVAKNSNAQIVSNYEIVQWYGKQGVTNGLPMNTGGKVLLGDVEVKWVSASHSSSLPDGTYGGRACGMILTHKGRKIYYAGDTALSMEMELIKRFDQPDLCILPIGDHFTMGIEDATRALDLVGCEKAIGMHYDTFPYILIDKKEALNAFEQAGKDLTLMEIGQSINW